MNKRRCPQCNGTGFTKNGLECSRCLVANRCPRCGGNLNGPLLRYPNRYLHDGINAIVNGAVLLLFSHHVQSLLTQCLTTLMPKHDPAACKHAAVKVSRFTSVQFASWAIPLQRRVTAWLYQPDEYSCATCGWQEGNST